MNRRAPVWEIFRVALKLGCTCFGGPVAHLAFFRDEYVARRKWLTEHDYADLVALCQFLPGPASSQVGIGVGLARGGLPGAVAAWLGFTLPSVLLMIAFGYGVATIGDVGGQGWLQGLKVAAVAVVAQAVWGMATTLCPDRTRATMAVLAAIGVLAVPWAIMQVVVIVAGALLGWVLFRDAAKPSDSAPLSFSIGHRAGVFSLVVFFVLLIGLPAAVRLWSDTWPAYFDSFYRSGSLVFGGGHVVLPMLKTWVVAPGWVTPDEFLAGYGAAQAVPGPLFTFAAYLGTVMRAEPRGWIGGVWCVVAVFLPSFLLVIGVIPFWETLRKKSVAQAALKGTNAAVVGLLLAALYDPVWTSAIHGPREFILALAAFGLLVFWKCPPWLVVLCAAAGGWVLL